MNRQDKFPETETFHYFNANTHNHKSGDCVIRAICTALNQTWEDTLVEMTKVGLKYGYVSTDNHVIEKYLVSKGWNKNKQPRKSDNTKFTGKEFCQQLNKYYFSRCKDSDSIIANIGGHHIVCISKKDTDRFKVYDIWDSTEGCIGNYWTKGR